MIVLGGFLIFIFGCCVGLWLAEQTIDRRPVDVEVDVTCQACGAEYSAKAESGRNA